MNKKFTLRSVIALLLALVGQPQYVFAQNEEKMSVTTQMFLNELSGDISFEREETQSQKQMSLIPLDESWKRKDKNDGRIFAKPDTIDGVAYIASYLRLNDSSNKSELEALGVIFQEEFNNGLHTTLIPVDKLNEVAGVSNVKRINVSPLRKLMTATARQKSNVDDVLTLSTDAISSGLSKTYDGSGVLLGVIDTGIDFNHIAFKDASGNSRIKTAYVYNGSSASTYTGSQITSSLTDDKSEDHGTHTSSTAGGSSVKVSGTTVTVTNDHANATYGGMAPGADLYLAGINSLSSTYLDNAVKYICTYADNNNQPVVVSNSWGSQLGPHDGTGDIADVYNSLFGDNYPNHIALFAASNDGGKSKDGEGGGYHISGTASSSSPLGSILRSASYSNTDAGYYYYGIIANAWSRSALSGNASLACKIYVLDGSGSVKTSVTVSPSTSGSSVSGLSSYFSGTLYAYKDYVSSDKSQIMLYTSGLTSKSYSQTTKDGNTYYKSAYTLAVEFYPTSGSCTIDAWGGTYGYYTNHLTTSGHTWTAGSDDMCVSDEATMANVISIGAYVSANTWTDYNGASHSMADEYTIGDIAYFSSYATAAESPTGLQYPWITAPGARLAAGVNHNHTASVDNYSYYGSSYNSDLVVNSSSSPYAMMEGTSMATPTAAGIVTLWLQAAKEVGKELTVNDVKEIMKETAITDSYTTTGSNASHFGNGKIDALAGIKYILGVSSSPTIKADKTEVSFEGYTAQTYTQEVTVTGTNLEDNITISKSGSSVFSVDKNSITQSDGTASATLTITYAPTNSGTQTGTITLSSSDADDVTITLTGTATEPTPTITPDMESMEFEAIKGSTDTQTLNISGVFLTSDVTVTVNGTGFSVSSTTLSASDVLADGGTDLTVTFKAPSTTGEYTGTLTLTCDGAETVTVVLTGVSNPKQTSKTIYKLVSAVTSGNEYLIVSINTAGLANAIGSSSSNSLTNYTPTVIVGDPGDGNSCTYIEDPNEYSVWTSSVSSSTYYFKIGNYYLYHNSGAVSMNTSNSKGNWTLGSNATSLYYTGGNTTRYLSYSNGWTTATSSAKVYFYEKTTIGIDEEDELIGDVNQDGSVDNDDVTALVNIILGNDDEEPYQYDHEAADVNEDGEITIADVTTLVNIIQDE